MFNSSFPPPPFLSMLDAKPLASFSLASGRQLSRSRCSVLHAPCNPKLCANFSGDHPSFRFTQCQIMEFHVDQKEGGEKGSHKYSWAVFIYRLALQASSTSTRPALPWCQLWVCGRGVRWDKESRWARGLGGGGSYRSVLTRAYVRGPPLLSFTWVTVHRNHFRPLSFLKKKKTEKKRRGGKCHTGQMYPGSNIPQSNAHQNGGNSGIRHVSNWLTVPWCRPIFLLPAFLIFMHWWKSDSKQQGPLGNPALLLFLLSKKHTDKQATQAGSRYLPI